MHILENQGIVDLQGFAFDAKTPFSIYVCSMHASDNGYSFLLYLAVASSIYWVIIFFAVI
jgi:hypothetical protein